MSSTQEKITKALQIAINMERSGIIDYLKYARKTSSKSGKDKLITLALDEVEHMSFLEKVLKQYLESNSITPVALKESDIPKLIPPLKNGKKELNAGEKSNVTDREILDIAITHEKKSLQYYQQNAEESQNLELKNIYTLLANEEKKHLQLLEAELDFISETGFWMGIPEFSVEV